VARIDGDSHRQYRPPLRPAGEGVAKRARSAQAPHGPAGRAPPWPAAGAPTAAARSPILFVDNQINPGTIAVAFRTDRPLDRKSNGKSIDGRAGVKGHSNSLSTFVKDKKPAYIAYVSGVSVAGGGEHLEVGHRYKVTINTGGQDVTRTVQLRPNTKESAVKKQLGY
jgi:hypothetical protein